SWLHASSRRDRDACNRQQRRSLSAAPAGHAGLPALRQAYQRVEDRAARLGVLRAARSTLGGRRPEAHPARHPRPCPGTPRPRVPRLLRRSLPLTPELMWLLRVCASGLWRLLQVDAVGGGGGGYLGQWLPRGPFGPLSPLYLPQTPPATPTARSGGGPRFRN